MKSPRLAPLLLSCLFFLLLALLGCNTATHKVSPETTTRPSLNAVEIRQLCRDAKAYTHQNDHDPKHAVELLDNCLQYPLMNYRRAEYLRERAWQKGLIEDYDGAYTDFAQVEDLVSEKANIIYDIGRTRMRQGDYEGAIKEFKRCIRLEKAQNISAHKRGGYRLEIAECLDVMDNLAGAIDALTDAIDIAPTQRSVAYGRRAELHIRIHYIQEAYEDIRKALKYNPRNAEAYVVRGFLKSSISRNPESAIKEYSKAIQINPKLIAAYVNRGLERHRQKKYHAAIVDYSEAIRLDPKNAYTFHHRGMAKVCVNDDYGALEDCNKAISLNSKSPSFYMTRGNVYRLLEKYSQACADFSTALEFDPKNAEAYYKRGRCKDSQQKPFEAIKDFSKAISEEPKYSEAYFFRAMTFLQLENFTEAIDDLTKVVQLEPINADAYHVRAFANLYMGMKEKALADAFKVLSLNPDYKLLEELQQLIEENSKSL